jgi:N-formylglutamate deformylase
MTPFEVTRGDSPIVLSMPHTGTFVPDDIAAQLNATGRALADTDWHIHRLYAGLLPDATTVRATFHRYVIDANRDPLGQSLYPGQNTTGLVPLTDFDGAQIWRTPPDTASVAHRTNKFHAPYHAALLSELMRIHALHGVAILYDCHSIRSHIPFLFDGTLPDFNIGTYATTSCDAAVETAVTAICTRAAGYSCVTNGRFKGGWTTRHYGKPAHGIHAVQMELAQSTHLTSETAPWELDTTKTAQLRPYLAQVLTTLADLAPTLRGSS